MRKIVLKKPLLIVTSIACVAALMFSCSKDRYHLDSLNGTHTWHRIMTEYTYDSVSHTQDSVVTTLSDTTFEVKVVRNNEIEIGGWPLNVVQIIEPSIYYTHFGLCDCSKMLTYNYKNRSIVLETSSFFGPSIKYYTP